MNDLVHQMGGFMNVVGIRSTLHSVLREHSIDSDALDPWYFPTARAYSALLSANGFRVESCGTFMFRLVFDQPVLLCFLVLVVSLECVC